LFVRGFSVFFLLGKMYIDRIGRASRTLLTSVETPICVSCPFTSSENTLRRVSEISHNRLTYEEVRAFFEEVRGFKLLETEYLNSETPMRYICTCGREAKISYKNAKKGKGCKECGRAKLSAAKQKYTYEDVKKYFEQHGCTLLSTQYNGPLEKLSYVCVCGTQSTTTWSKFKSGHRCKSCRAVKAANARRKYTMDEVKELFAQQGKTLLEIGEFRNSLQPLRYICACGEESTITLNNFLKGKDCYTCRNKKISESKKDPTLTDEEREERRMRPGIGVWRRAVFKRDHYTCQCCGKRGVRLNAHHIENYADNKELRAQVSNGITLCKQCHDDFHAKYGKRNNTREQLLEYLSERSDAV
jgi:hypothetical protein